MLGLQLGIGLGLRFRIVIQGHLDLENVFKKSRDSRVYSVDCRVINHHPRFIPFILEKRSARDSHAKLGLQRVTCSKY